VVFEVTIDAGPERRVFDERRRAAPPWLVVKMEGLGRSTWRMPAKFCRETPRGRAVGGARLDQTQGRTVDECVERIVEDYRRETEKMREPPPDPAEELFRGGLSWRRLARSG
jgi:hypothetical protein